MMWFFIGNVATKFVDCSYETGFSGRDHFPRSIPSMFPGSHSSMPNIATTSFAFPMSSESSFNTPLDEVWPCHLKDYFCVLVGIILWFSAVYQSFFFPLSPLIFVHKLVGISLIYTGICATHTSLLATLTCFVLPPSINRLLFKQPHLCSSVSLAVNHFLIPMEFVVSFFGIFKVFFLLSLMFVQISSSNMTIVGFLWVMFCYSGTIFKQFLRFQTQCLTSNTVNPGCIDNFSSRDYLMFLRILLDESYNTDLVKIYFGRFFGLDLAVLAIRYPTQVLRNLRLWSTLHLSFCSLPIVKHLMDY